MRLLGQMMIAPFTVFVNGIQMFVMTLQALQRVTNQNADLVVKQPPGACQGGNRPADLWAVAPVRDAALEMTENQHSVKKETNTMDDQDLSTDDLKYVSYAILFTKPDYEATLDEQQEELVNYPTTGASYGGLKIAKFFQALRDKSRKRPPEWSWDETYPSGTKEETYKSIPTQDEKYVTFVYHVKRRLPKQDPDRDKDKVTVLKEIRDRLGPAKDDVLKEISRKLG
jgi:hypothetical protein